MHRHMAVVTAAVVLATAVFGHQALAGGLIGDIVNGVAPGIGTKLDQWHKDIGQPLDSLTPGTQARTATNLAGAIAKGNAEEIQQALGESLLKSPSCSIAA